MQRHQPPIFARYSHEYIEKQAKKGLPDFKLALANQANLANPTVFNGEAKTDRDTLKKIQKEINDTNAIFSKNASIARSALALLLPALSKCTTERYELIGSPAQLPVKIYHLVNYILIYKSTTSLADLMIATQVLTRLLDISDIDTNLESKLHAQLATLNSSLYLITKKKGYLESTYYHSQQYFDIDHKRENLIYSPLGKIKTPAKRKYIINLRHSSKRALDHINHDSAFTMMKKHAESCFVGNNKVSACLGYLMGVIESPIIYLIDASIGFMLGSSLQEQDIHARYVAKEFQRKTKASEPLPLAHTDIIRSKILDKTHAGSLRQKTFGNNITLFRRLNGLLTAQVGRPTTDSPSENSPLIHRR